MHSDIDIYSSHPQKYCELQNLRPDYKKAIDMTVSLAVKYLEKSATIAVADFCGGTGNVTKKTAEEIDINEAVIIDINKEFLEIAQDSNIPVKKLQTIQSNIIDVQLPKKFDLIFSVFAYHHVPDNQKEQYLKIAQSGLKENGIFILTEIYLPDPDITQAYYKKLLNEIQDRSSILETFLSETANSIDFEFKVPKEFADKQLIRLGFREVETKKIWPLDDTFKDSVGTFVQVFKV